MGLVSLALNALSNSAVADPLLAYQLGIRTDNVYSKARIQNIDVSLLKSKLAAGKIPVIAGFQGVDSENNLTTLGRGGSDTSAVAIAAALQADVCEIYTDVDGVYTTDPRVCKDARKIKEISYEEMMELASLGAKVLHNRSVELAAKHGVALEVKSSFNPNQEGTKVIPQEKLLEKVVVAGVAAADHQVKISLQKIEDQPGVASQVFGALSRESIDVDVIVLDYSNGGGKLTISFTVDQADSSKALSVLNKLQSNVYPEMEIREKSGMAKVSIVGVGMQNNPGVASKMFELLAEKNINIQLITTSEIKVSCLVDSKDLSNAVNCLHQGFQLDRLS